VPDADVLPISSAIRVGDVGYMAASAKHLWVASSGGLVRIDPKALGFELIDELGRFGVAATEDAVWVTSFDDNTIDRLDPVTGKSTLSVAFRGRPNTLAIRGRTIWVAEHQGGAIAGFDSSSGKLLHEVSVGPMGFGGPQGIAANDEGIWVGSPNTSSVARLDPATNEVIAQVKVSKSPCGGIALQPEAVWVSTCFDDRFAIRLDPRTNALVAEIDLRGHNGTPILVDGYPWFPVGMRLVRINPAMNRVDRIVKVVDESKFESFGATIAFGAAWIGGADGVTDPRVIRIPLEALRATPSS
jgi:YVTN family beta-propeller protein